MSRPQRVWASSARRPYADQQMLAWAFAIAVLAAAVFGFAVGYLMGAAR